ncbi:MAG TPA: mercury resistance system periplasmic binding protein MerP [Burkholderiales bacterium]|nr:mercury resistance system periplasmic binding protein MerP [Burkholderiales bacterium]
MLKRFAALLAGATFAAAAWAGPRTVTLSVPGMTCPACPITVKTALSRVPGVDKVEIDYPKKTATVVYDDAKTGVAALQSATKDAGYPSKALDGAHE